MPDTFTSSFRPADIRNVALLGHAGCGKTTLIEAMLHRCGAITRMGSVEAANTLSDFEPESRQHKHSTGSSMLFATRQNREINLIDTPGYPDFIGHALAVLPAVETAIIVVNAATGIENNTRRLYHAAGEMNLARMIVINQIDRAADLPALVDLLRESLGPELHCMNLPTGGGRDVVDCFDTEAGEADFGSVAEVHREMVESVVETDDAEMEKYLAGEAIDLEELRAFFIKAMIAGRVVPIVFTAAKTEVGVDDLLHIIAEDIPSPATRPRRLSRRADDGSTETVECSADPDAPLLAHVFKVSTDPYVGKLAMARILRGRLDANTSFVCGGEKKSHKSAHILKIEGREQRPFSAALAGDIIGLSKIEDIHVNQMIHAPASPDDLRPILPRFPSSMYALAIEPKSRGDEVKISGALGKLAEEDPTFLVTHDQQTHELVIHGMGDLHLRVTLEKLHNRFGLEVTTKSPKIAFRETVSMPAEGHYRHRKQTGGAGQFGEVYLRIEPLERGKGFEFVNEVFGGAIPSQYIPSVEKGVHDLLEHGPVAGYPVQDVRVVVTDGKSHPVDSKDIAFRTAGKYAFRDAILKARPVLLEPVVTLDITVPEGMLGPVTGDLNGRRGRVIGTDSAGQDMVRVHAAAPLSELGQYSSQLRGASGGQGTFIMEFSHYDAVPPQLQAKIAGQYRPAEEAG